MREQGEFLSSTENSIASADMSDEDLFSGEDSDFENIYPYNYYSPRKIKAGNFD